MILILKDRAILKQKWTILKLNPCFIFLFIYIILKIMLPEQYTKRVKGNKSTVWLYFIPINEIIFVNTVKYGTCISIVEILYIKPGLEMPKTKKKKKKIVEILDCFPDIGTGIISFIPKGTHPYLYEMFSWSPWKYFYQ